MYGTLEAVENQELLAVIRASGNLVNNDIFKVLSRLCSQTKNFETAHF